MTTPNNFVDTLMSLASVLWPMFGLIVAIGIGFQLLTIVARFMRDDLGSGPTTKALRAMHDDLEEFISEKRKNDTPEEKEKPTAWRLGDDGEMVPVVSKRKNDDMFHQN